MCVHVLQAQVAGQSPSGQPPSARPETASPSQQEEEEEQQQQQQQAKQQTAEPASVGIERHLHRPIDSTPTSVNAALQHLLQQSRTSRRWHSDEVLFL